MGQGAVLCLGSVTGRSLAPMTIYAGNPAQPIKERKLPLAAVGDSESIGELGVGSDSRTPLFPDDLANQDSWERGKEGT